MAKKSQRAQPAAMSTAVLRIWSGSDDTLSSDPDCLAALLYLQLAIPRRFTVTRCANQETLPALVHNGKTVHGLSSIIHRVSGHEFDADIDKSLDAMDRAKTVAWCAYVKSSVADLTVCSISC